ncbi:MAG: hypothetical protein PHC46_04000 [Clostridia bacterium]|nr:hypothetical protein [Clostridia bacterium]
MRRIKKRVSPVKIILITLIMIVLINAGGNYLISEANYEKNLITEFDSSWNNFYVTYSYVAQLDNLDYGIFGNQSNISPAIACYNILRDLKLHNSYVGDYSLAEPIKMFDLYGSIAFGYLGTNVLAIKWYLESKSPNISVEITIGKENYMQKISESRFHILLSYTNNIGNYQAFYREDAGISGVADDRCRVRYTSGSPTVVSLLNSNKEKVSVLYTIKME